MKKILIITYYWPPGGGAGVQRWLKFAKYLPTYGWEPVIYTSKNPETPAMDESLLKDIPEGLEVHKRRIWEPMHAYRKFTGREKTERLGSGFLSESKAFGLRDKFAIWIRGNFFIPDAKRFWISPSYRYLKKYLQQNKVDLMVSTGPPHTVHLIACKLKTRFNLPWVADFRDPWTEIDFYKVLKLSKFADRKHKRLEKMVLDRADLVLSVGKRMAASFSEKTGTRQAVITNGYDEDDIPAPHDPVFTGKFILMHVGSVNKDRNHKILWEALKRLLNQNMSFAENFRFYLIGKLDHQVILDIEHYRLKPWIRIFSYIPHAEVIGKMQSASVLYLPLNDTPNAESILPGKLFEYFAAKRPILAVGPGEGELGQILEESHAGEIVGFNDTEGLIQAVTGMYDRFLQNQLFVDSVGIERYSRKKLTGKLVEELDQLLYEKGINRQNKNI